MLGYILSFLLGSAYKGSNNPKEILGELGRLSNQKKERDYIWSSVQNGQSFMYNLRSNDFDEEEWVFVRLPGDNIEKLEPDEISWEDFVELEPSFRPLGVWYKAHHRTENKNDKEIWVQVTNPEPGKYQVFAADYVLDTAIECCPVEDVDYLEFTINCMAAGYTRKGIVVKTMEIME